MGDESVERLLSVLIIVALSGKTDADAVRDISHTGLPNLFVEFGVDADIGGSHHGGRELANHLDRTRGLSLETILPQFGVQVNSVFTSTTSEPLGLRSLAWWSQAIPRFIESTFQDRIAEIGIRTIPRAGGEVIVSVLSFEDSSASILFISIRNARRN